MYLISSKLTKYLPGLKPGILENTSYFNLVMYIYIDSIYCSFRDDYCQVLHDKLLIFLFLTFPLMLKILPKAWIKHQRR